MAKEEDKYCPDCDCIKNEAPCDTCRGTQWSCPGICGCCRQKRDKVAMLEAEEEIYRDASCLSGLEAGGITRDRGFALVCIYKRSVTETRRTTPEVRNSGDANNNLPGTGRVQPNEAPAPTIAHREGCPGPACNCPTVEAASGGLGAGQSRNPGIHSLNMPDVLHRPTSTIQNIPRNNSSGAPSTGETIDVTRMFTGVKKATIHIPSDRILPSNRAASTGTQGASPRFDDFTTRFPTMAEIRGEPENVLFWSRNGVLRQSPRYIYVFENDELTEVVCGICYLMKYCAECGGTIYRRFRSITRFNPELQPKACSCSRPNLLTPDRMYLVEPDCNIGDFLTTIDAAHISLLPTRRYRVRNIDVEPMGPTLDNGGIDPMEIKLSVRCHSCKHGYRGRRDSPDYNPNQETMTFTCCCDDAHTAYVPVIHCDQDSSPEHRREPRIPKGSPTSDEGDMTHPMRPCDEVRPVGYASSPEPEPSAGNSSSADDRPDQLTASDAATQESENSSQRRKRKTVGSGIDEPAEIATSVESLQSEEPGQAAKRPREEAESTRDSTSTVPVVQCRDIPAFKSIIFVPPTVKRSGHVRKPAKKSGIGTQADTATATSKGSKEKKADGSVIHEPAEIACPDEPLDSEESAAKERKESLGSTSAAPSTDLQPSASVQAAPGEFSIEDGGSSNDVRAGTIVKDMPPFNNPLDPNVPGRRKWYCIICRCNSQYICSRCQNGKTCNFCRGKKRMRK